MKNILILLSPLLFSFSLLAQPEHTGGDYKKIEAYKTKFITEELDLSTEEAQKFWPVYNEYNKKLQVIFNDRLENMSHREVREKWDELSEEQLEQFTLKELEKQKKIAELKIAYFDKFKAAVGSRKAATFFRAEMEFRKHLMEMLGKRRGRRR